MIKILSLISLLIYALDAHGQLSISVSTDRSRYVSYEPVVATVTLTNYSGQSLHFGSVPEEGGYMIVNVTDKHGWRVEKLKKSVNPVENLILSAGVVKTISLSLTDFLAIDGDDDFELTIRIGHQRLARDFLSKPVRFEVRNGITVWERSVGVPASDANSRISTRTCSINSFHQKTSDLLYYLKIEDEEYVHSIVRLGPKIFGIDPQAEVDALSRIHTLLQVLPRLFKHRIFDLDGKLTQETTYLYDVSLPRLTLDPEFGMVKVIGGTIAQDGVHYNVKPEPKLEPEPIPKPESKFKRKFRDLFKRKTD